MSEFTTWFDYLTRIYELDLFPSWDHLRTSAEPISQYPLGLPEDLSGLVDIEKVDDEGIIWSIRLEQLEGTLGSITSGSKTIRQGEKYKYRHEFVAESFCMGKTDEPMSKIRCLDDDDDRRTPDFMIRGQNGKIIHVIELATCKSDRDDIVYRSYENKVFSYQGGLENRAQGLQLTYTCVIVTPKRVLTSMPLPDATVNDLVARMRMALALENKAELLSIDLEDDDRAEFRGRIKKDIEDVISRIKMPYSQLSPFIITKETVKTYLMNGDVNRVVEDFARELDETHKDIIKTNDSEFHKEITKFIKGFSEGNRRSDNKPISFFPFIVTKQRPPTTDIPKKSIYPEDELKSVTKLWSTAMDYYELNPVREEEDPNALIKEALEIDVEELRRIQSDRRSKMRQYHRVDLRSVLDSEEIEELAMQGLWAKKHRGEDFMKARRQHQQAGFKWSTPTSDIEDFLWDTSDLEIVEVLNEDPRFDLIRHANTLVGNGNSLTDEVEKWRKTKLFQALEVISDIAYEVAISNKQNCKTKEMILKKLRHYDVYLLISPTKSSEHTFISLYTPKPCEISHQGVFGKMTKVFGGYVSDFFSIKQGKLENQSSMPASLISLVSFWSWYYSLPDFSPQSFLECPEALFMLKFSLLVRLEDKAQTEETITQTRYMYMEVFKSNFSMTKPDPFKILSKLTNYPRSRLNLYCLKKIVTNFSTMIINPPKRMMNPSDPLLEEGEDAVPNDHWDNLINWVTGFPTLSASKIINLVYLGYLKNKMEPAEGNTDFQLVNKTIEEEFEMDKKDVPAYFGFNEGKPKPKQFSHNSIRHGCDEMEKRLVGMLGPDWKNILEKEILETLTSRMSIELATLKASANIDHNDTNSQATLTDKIGSNRIKVLEAVHRQVSEIGVNPMVALDKIINKIESSSRGVVCDLFKKQQHGGLREIYVLTIESRIVQLYIETISRVICSHFEEETLTHPRNKLKKLDEHRSNTARIAARDNCVYADFCSSTDKTRWNQNLVMPALAIPLLRFTTEKFHGSIVRILNMWTQKLIKLPQRVVNLLINNTEINSPTYRRLNEEFWTHKEGSIFTRKCGNFIQLTSGMMQGILHYTSSLLHLTFLNSINSIVPYLLRKLFPSNSFMMTQVCSSDDSATILSVFSPKGERDLTKGIMKACRKASHFMEAMNSMAPYYCMKNSVKSITSLIDYVEFNSEFLFRNTIAIPVIKFVAASLNITESESFLERFHTMYNLISDLFSASFPAQNTHVAQIAQALNHYKTMGSSVNPVFPFWSEQILSLPDPVLGFFIMDSSLCPGVLGYSYGLWKVAKDTNILKRSANSLLTDATEVLESGGVTQSLILKHGEVRRWRQLVDSISKNLDFDAILKNDPEVLFRPPQTIKELEIALAIKSTMPSVGRSMRRGNPYLQSLAMSVYAINTHCFSKTTISFDLHGKVLRETKKVSLLSELRSRLYELQQAPPVSREMLEATFPAIERYEECERIINMFKEHILIPCQAFRNRRTEVFVQPFSSFIPLSLQQCCLSLWFDHRVRTSTNIRNRCIAIYKVKLPWIKDNIHDTLDHSPFSTYQELANFINSHAIKSRTFIRIGPGVFSKRLTGQLYQLIRKSQKEGHVFRSGIKKSKEYYGSAEIISKLSLALALPSPSVRREQALRILTTSPRIYDNVNNIQKMSKRDSNLAYIQAFLKEDMSLDEICTSIQQTGTGMLYSYTKMQEKVEHLGKITWRGHGQCCVFTEQSLIVINMKDDIAESIEVSNWKKMRGHPSSMSIILRELGLRPSPVPLTILKRKMVAKFDGSHWVTPIMTGTPVYESSLLSPRFRDVEDISLEISFQSMSLTQKTYKGKLAIIRFKTYPGDVLINPSKTSSGDLTDCWLNQRPLESAKATAFILACCRTRRFSNEFQAWLIETLTARLSQKGLARGPESGSRWIPQIELTQQEQDLQLTDEMLEKIGMQIFEHEDELMGIPMAVTSQQWQQIENQFEQDDEVIEDLNLPDWAFVLHNWMNTEMEENIDITSRGVKDFKYLHPLWDKMIDELDETYPTFWTDTFKGVSNEGYSELSNCLISLVGIKKRPRLTGLKERAELQIKEILSSGIGLESPTTSPKKLPDEAGPSWTEEVEEEDEYGDMYEVI